MFLLRLCFVLRLVVVRVCLILFSTEIFSLDEEWTSFFVLFFIIVVCACAHSVVFFFMVVSPLVALWHYIGFLFVLEYRNTANHCNIL